MATSALQLAAKQANELLALYSPVKPPRFAIAEVEVLQPERSIKQALAEAQFILNQTSMTALTRRISALSGIRRRQRIINSLHLLSGSGFILLIANQFPDVTKWMGAIVSLSAGFLALALPNDAKTIEKEIFEDTNTVSTLSGEIARIQTQMLLDPDLTKDNLAGQIASTIGKCMELARKYELNAIAVESGFYPRLPPKEAQG
jgi:hypothetical protein